MSAIAYNDNLHLAYTQELRRKLVDQFAQDGKFPDDPKMLNILLGALKDYDKVTLTLKRIDADNENADADRQALAQFHRISAMTGTKDFTRVDTPVNENQEGPATPFDPNEITDTQIDSTELRRGADPVDYEQFMEEQTRLHQERLAKQA